MNKKLLFLFVSLLYLISACAQADTSQVGLANPDPSPTSTANLNVKTTEDPMMKSIRTLYVDSPHALKLSCESCHSLVDGVLQRELAWSDPEIGQDETVPDANKLCIKCHPSQDAANAMANSQPLAHPDFGCVDCHNAHTLQASCTQSACHSDIRDTLTTSLEKPNGHPEEGDPNNNYLCGGSTCHELVKKAQSAPMYHRYNHSQVPCTVCHDASGMMVDKKEDLGWVTLPGSAQDSGTENALVSHIIGREVACKKCHSTGNRYNLLEINQ